MAYVQSCQNHLAVVTQNNILYNDFDNRRFTVVELPRTVCDDDARVSPDLTIQCTAFSKCGKMFAACHGQFLTVWSTDNWSVLYTCSIRRRASNLTFCIVSEIIAVADKSGDVTFYSYSTKQLKNINTIILGHNSMLLDILVSHDEKYILTSDRDEKIRVSHFPNAYNIQSYCLNHKECVTCIKFLPTNPNVLVSASGDGSLCFWDYVNGKLLREFDFDFLDPENEDQFTTIVKVICIKQSLKESILAVLLHKVSSVVILSVEAQSDAAVSVVYLGVAPLNKAPWDICFVQDKLCCLLPDKQMPLRFFSIRGGKIEDTGDQSLVSENLSELWSYLEPCTKFVPDITLLYKREYDELSEYQERKKARLVHLPITR